MGMAADQAKPIIIEAGAAFARGAEGGRVMAETKRMRITNALTGLCERELIQAEGTFVTMPASCNEADNRLESAGGRLSFGGGK